MLRSLLSRLTPAQLQRLAVRLETAARDAARFEGEDSPAYARRAAMLGRFWALVGR